MAQRTLIATGRAERLLDGLLALARSDRGVLAREAHDLAVSAAAAVADVDGDAERAGLTVTSDLRPAPALGDPVLLDRLLSNLVDNAVRHNRPGGTVDVATGRRRGGSRRRHRAQQRGRRPGRRRRAAVRAVPAARRRRTDAATGSRPPARPGWGWRSRGRSCAPTAAR
jgi:signal transduction histidine kinase